MDISYHIQCITVMNEVLSILTRFTIKQALRPPSEALVTSSGQQEP